MSLFSNIAHKRYVKKYSKLYSDWKDDEYNLREYKFIWGVISCDDLSSARPCMYTMNDIDILYDRKKKLYVLEIETIYLFDSKLAELRYLKNLRQAFKNYLVEENIQIDYKPQLNVIRTMNGYNLFEAETLPELYYKFDLFVKGFENYLGVVR